MMGVGEIIPEGEDKGAPRTTENILPGFYWGEGWRWTAIEQYCMRGGHRNPVGTFVPPMCDFEVFSPTRNH